MGLTLINNTNLDYFPTEQQAAMFRLQGMLFEAMDDNSEQAAQLYFTALHIHDADAQSWLVWGKLCAAKAEKHAQDITKARGMEQSQKDLVRSPASRMHLLHALFADKLYRLCHASHRCLHICCLVHAWR